MIDLLLATALCLADVPAARETGGEAMLIHERMAAALHPTNLIFIGDSITAAWQEEGLPEWQRLQTSSDMDNLNLGIGGDTTRNVLWRLNHLDFRAASPFHEPNSVIVMIGTNNDWADTACIARGVAAVVNAVRAKFPLSEVILMAVLPRKDIPIEKTIELNAQLEKIRGARFLNIGWPFEREPPDLMWDGVHLTAAGYRIWADALMHAWGVGRT